MERRTQSDLKVKHLKEEAFCHSTLMQMCGEWLTFLQNLIRTEQITHNSNSCQSNIVSYRLERVEGYLGHNGLTVVHCLHLRFKAIIASHVVGRGKGREVDTQGASLQQFSTHRI